MRGTKWLATGLAVILSLLSACGTGGPAATDTPAPTLPPVVSPSPTEAPRPMKLSAALPDGAVLTEEQPDDGTAYHNAADEYRIFLTWEAAGADTDTPGKFRETILNRLAKENQDDNYVEGDCVETLWQSYVAYQIGWLTGAGEREIRHQALFILTDAYIYRAQFDVRSSAAETYAEAKDAFFDSVEFRAE